MSSINDYQGQAYDFDTLSRLVSQLGAYQWNPSSNGGIYSAINSGGSAGFDRNALSGLTGSPLDARQQVMYDMARGLMRQGVTDLGGLNWQDKKEMINPGESEGYWNDLSGWYDPAGHGIVGGKLGETFTGDGTTEYQLVRGPDGKPMLSTSAATSSDKGAIAPFAMMLGGIGAAMGGVGGVASGVSGLGEAGAANGMWDYLPAAVSEGGGSTATMGAAGAGGLGSAGTGAGVTGFGDAGTMYAGVDGTAAGTLGGGASVAGGSALGAGTTGSSLLSNLGAKDLLGIGSTLLGAVSGAKGQSGSQTTNRDIPEWLKPYVSGEGGLLPAAQKLFQQQTAPGAMPGYAQMQNAGMGLLAQPVAGNPFANGYRGGGLIRG